MPKVLKMKKPKQIYQLKISLVGIKPLIWRRILVDSEIKLPDLHKIIQTVMGWYNSHLHQFYMNNTFYSLPDEFSYEFCIDYRKIKLNQLITNVKQRLHYEYDFGDGWDHLIVLEKILPGDIHLKVPVCIDGKRNRPPEDCGGTYGYNNLCEIIKNPDHEEYEEMMEWLGGEYDPEEFDINIVNTKLKMKNYGCYSF